MLVMSILLWMWNENYENSPLQRQVTGEGQRHITVWKNNRLVAGGINNSECSISKADFCEVSEDKVTPVRKTALYPLFTEKRLVQIAEFFFVFLFFNNLYPSVKKWEELQKEKKYNTQSQNEVAWAPNGRRMPYQKYSLMKWRTIKRNVVWSSSNSVVEVGALQIKQREGTWELMSWLIWRDNVTERWPTAMWNS